MEKLLFLFLLTGSCYYFFHKLCRRILYISLGRPARHTDRPLERWKYFASNVLGQKKVRRYPIYGLGHACIMYGFVILLPAIPNMAAVRLYNTAIPFVGNNALYLFVKDLFIVLVMAGVTVCLWRRAVKKPEWLKNNTEAIGLLLLIFIIVLTEALYNGTSLALQTGGGTIWPAPLAGALSGLFYNKPAEHIRTAEAVFWWTHFLAFFSMLWIIPNSKHLHMLFAPFNLYWHSLDHRGALETVDPGSAADGKAGVDKMEDFTWKQLFEAYTCTKCGRCNDQCPAHQSGEPVKPKPLQGRFRKHIEERAPLLLKQKSEQAVKQVTSGQEQEILKKKITGDIYKKDFIWGCAMCGSCEDACPVSIEHTPKIIAMRRHLVLVEKDYPEKIQQFFNNVELYGTPWGAALNDNKAGRAGSGSRAVTGSSLGEYIYFPGCAASSDPGAGRTAVALSNILQNAGLSFTTLGADEWCCGETARRLGNEALFQQIVKNNIKRWDKPGVRKIITSCPHCYNTLKNEYPRFGGYWEIIHHSVLLAALLRDGRLKPVKQIKMILTYHDPCYLGRYNDVYSEPREILRKLPGVRLVETQRSANWSFCCGAGGGRFWTMDEAENLIASSRVQQVAATGASVLGTACPYCKLLLEETIARRGTQAPVQVLDIAELLERAL
jgi:Fe-S oxidoreductase